MAWRLYLRAEIFTSRAKSGTRNYRVFQSTRVPVDEQFSEKLGSLSRLRSGPRRRSDGAFGGPPAQNRWRAASWSNVSPVCPQFLTSSAFSPRWHLDQRPGRGTFIRPSPSGVSRPPSSISGEVGHCEHRGAGKADPPAVVHVISLFNTQELYFRNCPVLLMNYKFELLTALTGY